jgi:ABC-2 type transport system permease protein
VSWAVISDREQYRTIRQLYTTPMDGYFYLMGRGVARLLIGLVSVLITIVFGVIAFKLPIVFAAINWPLFIVSTVLGVFSLAMLGMVVAALTMMMARHYSQIGDAIAGALYLFTGAIFPLDVLPVWLRPVGLIFPVTYWLELARRALLGAEAAKFPTFASFSDMQLLGILAVLTLVYAVASIFMYRWCLHTAKETGFFDMETSY